MELRELDEDDRGAAVVGYLPGVDVLVALLNTTLDRHGRFTRGGGAQSGVEQDQAAEQE